MWTHSSPKACINLHSWLVLMASLPPKEEKDAYGQSCVDKNYYKILICFSSYKKFHINFAFAQVCEDSCFLKNKIHKKLQTRNLTFE